MAKKDSFSVEEAQKMVPILEGDQQYGIEIVKLYDDSIRSGMRSLFIQGAIGMTLNEPVPQDIDILHKVISSQNFARSDEQEMLGKGVMAISDGTYVSAKLDHTYNLPRSLRWYKCVRLQGDYKELLGEDYPEEGTGTIAVALAGNLALAGIMPSERKDSIIMRELKIASMAPDDEHDEVWLAIEFDLYVHNDNFAVMGLPRDVKTGYVPLDVLQKEAAGVS